MWSQAISEPQQAKNSKAVFLSILICIESNDYLTYITFHMGFPFRVHTSSAVSMYHFIASWSQLDILDCRLILDIF